MSLLIHTTSSSSKPNIKKEKYILKSSFIEAKIDSILNFYTPKIKKNEELSWILNQTVTPFENDPILALSLSRSLLNFQDMKRVNGVFVIGSHYVFAIGTFDSLFINYSCNDSCTVHMTEKNDSEFKNGLEGFSTWLIYPQDSTWRIEEYLIPLNK